MGWKWIVVAVMGLRAVGAGPQGIAAQGIAGLGEAAPTAIVEGKRALAGKEFQRAKGIFAAYVRLHRGDVQGMLGEADAELGLREYEAAELEYRRVVAAQPLLWAAHKNLVIVEAALGRWEEFDREREVLRAARERGATGISRKESDVIDVVLVHGRGGEVQRWIVRDYFEPLGRARARYNFERFGADGRVAAYVSLESATAFADVLKGGDVVVGAAANRAGADADGFALDWYDGKSHGVIARYLAGEAPRYEAVRTQFLKWSRGK